MSTDPMPAAPPPPASWTPYPKVTAATAGAALGTVIVVIIDMLTDADIPLGLEGALATIGAFVLGYLAPPRGA